MRSVREAALPVLSGCSVQTRSCLRSYFFLDYEVQFEATRSTYLVRRGIQRGAHAAPSSVKLCARLCRVPVTCAGETVC
jgi:hypothetical protein